MRSLLPSKCLSGIFLPTVEPDKKTRYIYKAFMEKSIFFVSHGQISEIIGDEPSMDSEINCLCNVASGRKIWLTLGSKRKSVDPMEINIGDWVTVSNHGEIKKIVLGKNMQKFRMRCFMKNYEQGNNAIHKRHPTLFKDKKDHYYSFRVSDELVQTLPLEFVDNLNSGAYTKIPSKWMTNIQSKLTQSQRNSITSIQLVRSLLPSDNLCGIFPPTVEPDKKTCYIYKAFMEKLNFL